MRSLLEAARRYFNPRSPCGERHLAAAFDVSIIKFQSTLPVWGATLLFRFLHHSTAFQSTLPVWGATSATSCTSIYDQFQSTLPVWGATVLSHDFQTTGLNFNPRSPCGERRILSHNRIADKLFQSTLPVWGATVALSTSGLVQSFQSTLPVWGATLGGTFVQGKRAQYFNPRSPCGERPS